MDSKKRSDKDENFRSNYEENSGDSDIESRLYAEIHYSNNVIGNESSSVQDQCNNSFESMSTRKHSSAIPNIQSQINLKTSDSNNALSIQQVPIDSAQNNAGVSTIMNMANDNPVQLQSNSNSNSKKRPIPTDSQGGQSKRKKKKQQTKTDNINDRNRIINPYHKDVVNNQQYGIKLLSPAFLHLFFGKSKGKNKKKKKVNALAQPSKVSISSDTSTPNTNQESGIQKVIENQVIQEEAEVSNAQDSETIIDICSDSSQDSIEDNSKYHNIEATDKKLTKQSSVVSNENSEDDTSDSDESIFEVPVPPKPAPPIIDLNDSDNENQELSDSHSSASSQDSYQGNSESMNRSVPNISENLEENSDSESSEHSNLILNCTEIQKGASSINEIKRMSSEISSKTSTANETNTCNASDNSKNDSEVPGNAVSRENTISSVKKLNSSVTKQISKSSQKQASRNGTREESFFQPMSDKMKSFYNDSWGGENFDMETLKSKMTRDPKKWAILDDDLIVTFSRRKRYFGMVCSRCQKEGHRQNQCPVPYKPPSCHMCGMQGHLENNCPEKKCLTCGRKQNMYRRNCEQCVRMVCSRCKARGHMEHFCPDLWRSFHQTVNNTKPNVPKNFKNVMKPQHSLYCCNCAKKGHDSQNCRKLRWSEHLPVPSHVISYDGPEYSKENVGTESNLNNSNSFSDNTFTPSNVSDKSVNRNLAGDNSSHFSKNQTLVADKNVIFQIKSKISDQNEGLTKMKLNLEIPNKNEPGNYNYWTKLSTFLFDLVNEIPGEFLLRQNNGKVVMEMNVPRKKKIVLKKLIQQYAGRNNFERSHMYLKCDRNPNHLKQLLTSKFNEMKNLTLSKSILELYDELIRLKSSENDQQESSTLKKQKLMVCQKELLAALYRENCASNSHLILKQMLKKKTRTLKKINVLLEYLIHYNDVFVPHEPQKLNTYIANYKAQQERRERLRNNPLIMESQGNSATCKSTAKRSSFSSTMTTESVLTTSSSTSCQIPNLLLINTSTVSQIQPIVSQIQPSASQMQPEASQIQPSVSHIQPVVSQMQSPVSQIEPSIPSDASRPLLSINTSISSNFHFSQDQPTVHNVKSKSAKKLRTENNYKNFLKKATQLIEDARKVNKPQVRKYAEILENKIKNGIFLFSKDAATLRALINRSNR